MWLGNIKIQWQYQINKVFGLNMCFIGVIKNRLLKTVNPMVMVDYVCVIGVHLEKTLKKKYEWVE